jgi:hypothetical protein
LDRLLAAGHSKAGLGPWTVGDALFATVNLDPELSTVSSHCLDETCCVSFASGAPELLRKRKERKRILGCGIKPKRSGPECRQKI